MPIQLTRHTLISAPGYKSCGGTSVMSTSAPFDNAHSTLTWKHLLPVASTDYRTPEANRPLLLLPGGDQ